MILNRIKSFVLMEACEKLTGVDDLTSLIQVPLNLETPANNSPDVTWIQLKPSSNTSKAFFLSILTLQ